MSLVLESVSAGYPGRSVLRDVSLTARTGEFVTVLGPSGGGKTTLLRVIAGLHRPDAGRVVVDGRDLTGVPVERRAIGLVPQEGALFPHRDVAANVGYGAPRAARGTRVAAMLELVGLADYAKAMPHELSGGQRQRVALARAMAPEPRVLLLDEPFNALDAALRQQVRAETAEILRRAGTTAVLITHDRDEALSLSDRVAVLDSGRIVGVGEPRVLYERPPDDRVAGLLGPMHLLAGERRGDVVVTVLGPLVPMAPGVDGSVQVLLRPERLELTAPEAAAGPGHAVVQRIDYFGTSQTVYLTVDGLGPLAVQTPAGLALAVGSPGVRAGDAVRVRVDGAVHVLPRVHC